MTKVNIVKLPAERYAVSGDFFQRYCWISAVSISRGISFSGKILFLIQVLTSKKTIGVTT
ncbi:MAG: hypothetical protein JRC89_05545 [Deltaproteobacteria bacterium]|nr:hypothetical protein [Deltaproteobacteria bacterium]